jgi:acyl-CoA thioesterase-1
VILELGSNDGLRGLPLSTVEQNLMKIIRRCHDAKVKVVLVGMRLPENYGPEYTQHFQEMFRHVAKTMQTPLVPFLLERIASDEANFQNDRLHPIARVQNQLMETVWPTLIPLLHQREPLGTR